MNNSRPDFGSIFIKQDNNDPSNFGIGIVVAIIVSVFLIPLMMMEPAANTAATTTYSSNRVLRPAYRPNPIFWKPYRPYPKH